jgi:hypothetical protein
MACSWTQISIPSKSMSSALHKLRMEIETILCSDGCVFTSGFLLVVEESQGLNCLEMWNGCLACSVKSSLDSKYNIYRC